MISQAEYIECVKNINPFISVIGKYKGKSEKIEVTCDLCGHVWSTRAGRILEGSGCPICARKKNRLSNDVFLDRFKRNGNKNIILLGNYEKQKTRIPVQCSNCGYTWKMLPDSILRGAGCPKCAGNLKKTTDSFKKDLKEINPYIKVIGEYVNNKTHIKVKCKKCKNVWTALPSNLLRNYGCPKCNGGVKMSEQVFLDRMHQLHPDIEVLEKYQNINTPLKFKCLRCGNVWKTIPNTVLNGGKSSCPGCAHNQTSYLERLILEMCKEILGKEKVLSRDRNTISKELDIVILNEQEKPIYAIEPGSWTLHRNNYETDLLKLKECENLGIKLLIIYDQDKNEEVKQADNIWSFKKSFSRTSDKETLELLNKISAFFHFDVVINEKRFNELKRIAYESSRRISTDQFKKQLFEINPQIEVVGEYNGSMKKTELKCRKCGYEWRTTPGALLKLKTGCPQCANVPRIDTLHFKERMEDINPQLVILGEYKNAKTKILTRCKKCGYEWMAIPDKLRIGRGCPICSRRKGAESKLKPVCNLDTMQKYPSVKKAIEETGIKNIAACCRGDIKTAGGFRWSYIKK